MIEYQFTKCTHFLVLGHPRPTSIIIIIACTIFISQDSRATTHVIYASIGPNDVNRVQKDVIPDDHIDNYKVQYAEISYNAKAPQILSV